jgi:hypothetical protein
MAETLSQADFARRVGLTTGRISQLKKQGLIAMSDDGRVLVEETEWRLADRPKNYRGGVTKPVAAAAAPAISRPSPRPDESPAEAAERIVVREGGAPYDHAEAVRIKENYLALLRQLEFDLKSGAVVPIDVVIAVLVDQLARVRNKVLSIGVRAAPRAAVLRSAEEVKALLDTEIGQALEELTLDDGALGLDDLRDVLRERFGPVH